MFSNRALAIPYSQRPSHIRTGHRAPEKHRARQRLTIAALLLVLSTSSLFGQEKKQKPAYITFDPPGSTDTEPKGINRQGTITGFYYSPTVHSFVREPDGKIISINFPTASTTMSVDINDAGAITGTYWEGSSSVGHGFVREPDGNLVSFDPVGSTET
jgi:hypothetical protein